MEIPSKVKIGYKTYKVNMIDGELVDSNKVCYGIINFDDGDINISRLYSQDQQECTLIHECLHGIDDIVEAELSKEQIRKLGKGIYLFIKDNPDIFIYKSVVDFEQSSGEQYFKQHKNKIDVVSYDPYVVKEKIKTGYMNKSTLLTVTAQPYVNGMEDGVANLDGFNYPYIKDFRTNKVYIIKPDATYVVVTSVTENNPNGDRFVLSKEKFEKEYEKIV